MQMEWELFSDAYSTYQIDTVNS